MPTRYELLYILPTTLTDDEVGGIESKVNATLTKVGAVIESTKRLGKFKLAYPIKGQRHGHYVLVFFTAETSTVTKIDELLRIMPEMVRHLTLRADEAGEQKFDLVQFAEIVVEGGREERRRRERAAEKEEAKKTEEAPKKLETETPAVVLKQELSAEELEKKIESALSDDVKGV